MQMHPNNIYNDYSIIFGKDNGSYYPKDKLTLFRCLMSSLVVVLIIVSVVVVSINHLIGVLFNITKNYNDYIKSQFLPKLKNDNTESESHKKVDFNFHFDLTTKNMKNNDNMQIKVCEFSRCNISRSVAFSNYCVCFFSSFQNDIKRSDTIIMMTKKQQKISIPPFMKFFSFLLNNMDLMCVMFAILFDLVKCNLFDLILTKKFHNDKFIMIKFVILDLFDLKCTNYIENCQLQKMLKSDSSQKKFYLHF